MAAESATVRGGTGTEHVEVAIVGGGGVGLATALFLARQGIRPLLLERHADTSRYPRATGVSPRTRELLREAGLEEKVLEAGSEMSRSGGKIIVETLAGTDLGRAERISPVPDAEAVDVVARSSPVAGADGVCPQDVLEPILLDAAREAGTEVRFGALVEELRQDDERVTLRVSTEESDTPREIVADYVIGADGANSSIRTSFDVPSSGPGPLGSPMITVLFQSDLSDLVRGHEFVVAEVRGPETEGLLLAVNNTDRWVFYISCPPESGRRPADFTPDYCADVIREAIGIPDLDVDVLAVMPWQAAASVADEMRRGRVFLVGDSAHVMPPSGAYGLNTGIADAHNLAWKLAYVLRGIADEALLDTYESERLPVGRFTMEQAMLVQRNPRLHWDLTSFAGEREQLGMAHPVVVSLCPQYASRAVVSDEGDGRDGTLVSLTDPGSNLDGHPGSRVPHLWVETSEGERISTLDVCGEDFLLLFGADAHDWRSAAVAAASRLGLTLTARQVAPGGSDLNDTGEEWATRAGVKSDGALLVRPDGYVAWRAEGTVPTPEADLRAVLSRVLGHRR